MKRLKIRRRQAVLAAGASLIILVPLLSVPLLKATHAHAELGSVTTDPAPVVSFAAVVAADKPAVVTITTKHHLAASDRRNYAQPLPDEPFGDFLRRFFGNNGMPLEIQPGPVPPGDMVDEALGSGFLIDASGMIVTNDHVVEGADEITVMLDDGTELPATLVGADNESDLAVVHINAEKPLPFLSWGNSDAVQPGDPVLAIGNPFGIGTTVTSGIVSARGRDLNNGPYDDFIQVDASINRGNSGGPLVDSRGMVIGINTAIYSPNGGSVGVGFAIPSQQARSVVAKLEKDGTIAHGYLGVYVQPVTELTAEAIGLDKKSGALVADVEVGAPGEKAGLKPGDIILTLGGEQINSPRKLARVVADLPPGSARKAEIWRQGRPIMLTLTVAGRDEDMTTTGSVTRPISPAEAVELKDIGIGVANLTPEVSEFYQLDPGETGAVVDNIDPYSAAAGSGLEEGDVIISVNQIDVHSAQDVSAAVEEAAKSGRKAVMFEINNHGEQGFVTVPFDKT